MNKFMLNLFLGLALLMSNQPTQCAATDYRETIVTVCGGLSVLAGLYLLTKSERSGGDTCIGFSLTSVGFGQILAGKTLVELYDELASRAKYEIRHAR